ncbi:MAG: LysR family transcriptional regulator [Novosphingobium pentaromativorans]|uniref:LysR family transcriptional regulator n=1 Tax=Novosphingobium pentaromativorans TaxID=205844 RepID=A0A2W5QGI2_9SPHN|nr:LysR family transcriptional regulator [Novosphingobium panipatense]PZQ56767.1 MAG: LysR family transcriptional regulator [Novosphingobium pentaromativorans]
MDFIQRLRVFVAVTENRSFARTAEALRMTRPGVTNAINALEDSVGARLFHRTTRRVSLTVEGEQLHERALQLLADVDETQGLFGGSGERPRGRLRVDIPVAIAKPFIIPALPQFIAAYPDVEVILGVSDQPVDLLAEGVDCVIRLGHLPESSMVGRVIAQMEIVICASPAYLDAHGTPQTFDDLTGHKAVNYFAGRGHRPMPWQIPDSDGLKEIVVKSGVMVNDTEAFIASTLAGLGLAQGPGACMAEHLKSGALVEVLPNARKLRRPLSVMYPAQRHLAPQVRAFIDWSERVIANSRNEWIAAP